MANFIKTIYIPSTYENIFFGLYISQSDLITWHTFTHFFVIIKFISTTERKENLKNLPS